MLSRLLADLDAAALTTALTGGLRQDEVAALAGAPIAGLVSALAGSDDFVIDPLPNLLFTRDSSAWVGDQVAVTSLAMPARRRETSLTEVIYRHHPRFAGTELAYERGLEPVEGGDVLLLGPGVVAVGTGERTTPAGVERLAHRLLSRGLAHTVLAVPIAQERATMHLDTVCTMVDVDAMVMYPALAATLQALPMTLSDVESDAGATRAARAARCGSGRGSRSCGPRPRPWGSPSSGSSTPGSTR